MARRPVIGVSGPDRGGLVAWLMTALAVRRCGARPLRIRPSAEVDRNRLDAVIIGGGTDVDPFHYGAESEEEPADADDEGASRRTALDWLVGLAVGISRAIFASHTDQGYDPRRDELEKGLIQHALRQQLPVLGICRGAQLMNVVLGGSLHQAIGHFYTEETGNIRSILPRKTINITRGSRLHEMLETETGFVNALHNQSIDQLGEGVTVSAVEPSGVIQAIEKREHRFFIGVQWHPEYMPQSTSQKALFHGLISCARTGLDGDD